MLIFNKNYENVKRYGIPSWVMKIYRYTDKDREIIARARNANKDKRAEKRLYALELKASGKSAKRIATEVGFKSAYSAAHGKNCSWWN